jgi:hypothetical protein
MDLNLLQSYIPNPQRTPVQRGAQPLVQPLRERDVRSQQDAPKLLPSPEALAEKSRQAEVLRVQRVNNSEFLPLSSQKALHEYQATQQFSTTPEEGELVGIDLFV